MMCGGFSIVHTADEETQTMVNEMKSHVEGHLNATFTVYKAVSYTTQVVAGTNYLVKVEVDDGKTVTVKIHRPLPCNGTQLQLLEADLA